MNRVSPLTRSFTLSLALTAIAGCASEDAVTVDLHWTITSASLGSRSCLDVDAVTVEWTLLSEQVEHVFRYDCVDSSNRHELVPEGAYTVTAKLERADGAVLAQCLSSFDSARPTGVETCAFEVP